MPDINQAAVESYVYSKLLLHFCHYALPVFSLSFFASIVSKDSQKLQVFSETI